MRQMETNPVKREQSFALGGQALIEGVMMRSSTHVVLCIRHPNKEIVTHVEEIKSIVKRNRILGLPFIRGAIMLVETMYLGIKGIFYSANVALEEENVKLSYRELLIVVAMVLAMGSFFVIAPFLITSYLNLTDMLFNATEAALRLSFFILYLFLVSRWGEFRRVLQYHGAEHKAINAHEAGVPMDVGGVSKFSRMNPRCGTSFLFIVVLVSIAMFSLIPKMDFAMRIAYRMLLVPVIGSISYELLKFSDRHRDSPVMKIVTAPGMAFQRLTTKEPENGMIEVAIKALEEIERLSVI